MPFRPPTFRLVRRHESSLAAFRIVKHGDAPRPQPCPFAPARPVDLSGIIVVAVGSRGLPSLNWQTSSPPHACDGWSLVSVGTSGPAKGR